MSIKIFKYVLLKILTKINERDIFFSKVTLRARNRQYFVSQYKNYAISKMLNVKRIFNELH